jgi:hypothetical protein
VSVVCCLRVSVVGRSLVQRVPTECGVSDCDLETSIMRFWPTRAVETWREETSYNVLQKKSLPFLRIKSQKFCLRRRMTIKEENEIGRNSRRRYHGARWMPRIKKNSRSFTDVECLLLLNSRLFVVTSDLRRN